MNSSTVAYKVHVKLGPAEFEAEGPEETVKEQLAHFFIAATQPSPLPNKTNGNGTSNGNGAFHGNGESEPKGDSSGLASDGLELRTSIEPTVLQRLFKRSDDGLVSLRALPKSDARNADTLILILWGHFVLKNQGEVGAGDLLSALRQSGITSLDRVDETLERKGYVDFITTSGSRRHKSYGLTNRGMTYAQNVAKAIFD